MKSYVVSALAVVALAMPLSVSAQAPALGSEFGPKRALTLQAGGFSYDQIDADRSPMLGLQMNWALSPLVVSEVGVTGSQVSLPGVLGTDNRRVGTLTVGVQAQAPLPYVQPYVGVSTGVVREFDRVADGHTVRSTHAFPVGVRVPLSQHVGLRGEVRYRFDDLDGGRNVPNTERTLGVTVRF
jgi:hypothetical protein